MIGDTIFLMRYYLLFANNSLFLLNNFAKRFNVEINEKNRLALLPGLTVRIQLT